MIPTLLLLGLVLGRWWRVVVPAATVGWVILVVATGVGSGVGFILGAAAFAFANVALGVLVYQIARQAVRLVIHNQA